MSESFLSSVSHSNFTQSSPLTPVQAQMDGIVSTFVERAMDVYSLTGIAIAGRAGRSTYSGVLSFSRSFTGYAPRLLASVSQVSAHLAGCTIESIAMDALPRILKVSSKQSDVSLLHLFGMGGAIHGAFHTGIGLVGFKWAGIASAYQNILFQALSQSTAMMVSHQLSGFFGITDMPRESLGHEFAESQAVVLQLWTGMRALYLAAPSLVQSNQAKDLKIEATLRIEANASATKGREGLTVLAGTGFHGMAMKMEGDFGSARRSVSKAQKFYQEVLRGKEEAIACLTEEAPRDSQAIDYLFDSLMSENKKAPSHLRRQLLKALRSLAPNYSEAFKKLVRALEKYKDEMELLVDLAEEYLKKEDPRLKEIHKVLVEFALKEEGAAAIDSIIELGLLNDPQAPQLLLQVAKARSQKTNKLSDVSLIYLLDAICQFATRKEGLFQDSYHAALIELAPLHPHAKMLLARVTQAGFKKVEPKENLGTIGTLVTGNNTFPSATIIPYQPAVASYPYPSLRKCEVISIDPEKNVLYLQQKANQPPFHFFLEGEIPTFLRQVTPKGEKIYVDILHGGGGSAFKTALLVYQAIR
jgi:hypothetical protein